jgi:hypothetical protein
MSVAFGCGRWACMDVGNRGQAGFGMNFLGRSACFFVGDRITRYGGGSTDGSP